MLKVAMGLVAFAMVGSGCGLNNNRYHDYDFAKGAEKTATVGSPMITWSDTYRNDSYHVQLKRFDQTLTYSGMQGTTIRIAYREAETVDPQWGAGMMARPAFTQELTYDLANGDAVAFRGTKLKVVEAKNDSIRFIVTDCPCYAEKPGSKVQGDATPTNAGF